MRMHSFLSQFRRNLAGLALFGALTALLALAAPSQPGALSMLGLAAFVWAIMLIEFARLGRMEEGA